MLFKVGFRGRISRKEKKVMKVKQRVIFDGNKHMVVYRWCIKIIEHAKSYKSFLVKIR